MIRNENFIGSKRAVDCENYAPTHKGITKKDKARGEVKKSIEQILEAIAFKKQLG